MLCYIELVHSPDSDPIDLVSNQMYITYQMKASVIDTISACSLLSIEYLTVDSIMGKGPAAEYNSECIHMSECIRIRIEWVKS